MYFLKLFVWLEAWVTFLFIRESLVQVLFKILQGQLAGTSTQAYR